MSNVRLTNRVLSAAEMNTFPLDLVSGTAFCVQGSPATDLATLVPLGLQSPGTVATSELTVALRSYNP